MSLMLIFMILLGVCALGYLLYLVINNQPVPPSALRLVLLALILMFVICLAHTAGCSLPGGEVPIAP